MTKELPKILRRQCQQQLSHRPLIEREVDGTSIDLRKATCYLSHLKGGGGKEDEMMRKQSSMSSRQNGIEVVEKQEKNHTTLDCDGDILDVYDAEMEKDNEVRRNVVYADTWPQGDPQRLAAPNFAR